MRAKTETTPSTTSAGTDYVVASSTTESIAGQTGLRFIQTGTLPGEGYFHDGGSTANGVIEYPVHKRRVIFPDALPHTDRTEIDNSFTV